MTTPGAGCDRRAELPGARPLSLTPRLPISRVLKPSAAYAGIVFGVGFALGCIRVFFIAPRIGVRWAELLETPLMLFASFLAARLVMRLRGPFGRTQCLLIGILALAFMLLAEVGFVLVQGFTIPEYIGSRDPISGTVYLLSLAVFAAMPLLVSLAWRPENSSKTHGSNRPVP